MVSSEPSPRPSRNALATTSRPSLALLGRHSMPTIPESLIAQSMPNVENESSQGQDVASGNTRILGNRGADADELDHTESIGRSFAFAGRARNSGSGLPRDVAELKRMIDVAKDNDAQTADLFAQMVSRKIHLDRRLEKQARRFIDRKPDVQHWSAGKNRDDKNAFPDLTEEQRIVGPWVERMYAYGRRNGRTVESTSNQGAAPVRARKTATARPLREILLAHIGEKALQRECYAYGICYRAPRPIRLRWENMPVDGCYRRPRRLHTLHDLTSDLSRKLLPQKQRRRRGPPMSIALRESLEDLALM